MYVLLVTIMHVHPYMLLYVTSYVVIYMCIYAEIRIGTSTVQ